MARGRKAEAGSDASIAKILGISKTRVYQIRTKAIKKIRIAILEDPELRQYVIDNIDPNLPIIRCGPQPELPNGKQSTAVGCKSARIVTQGTLWGEGSEAPATNR